MLITLGVALGVVVLVGAVLIALQIGGNDPVAAAPVAPSTSAVPTSQPSTPEPPVPSDEPTASDTATLGKYESTWEKDYKDTTCADFTDVMDKRERFVTAHIFITAMNDDKAPRDVIATKFAENLNLDCLQKPGQDLTAVAAVEYTSNADKYDS